MYLEHFGFNYPPFSLTPCTHLFLGLEPHYQALCALQAALKMGEGVLKVTGEVGTGKTMLCRVLMEQLPPNMQLVYLPNPVLNGAELQRAVAAELGIEVRDSATLVNDIQQRLLTICAEKCSTVLIVDEAQSLSDDALETLRLFGNLETADKKLLQLVLFGQPELDERLNSHQLRQLRQRITFSASLRPLKMNEGVAYIDNRLTHCGGRSELFSLAQKKVIWHAAGGIARLINQLCHKSLLLAFYQKHSHVTNSQLFTAIWDTCDAVKPRFRYPVIWGWSKS